ncbi:MAG TPA: alpha/beta fold hydrolase [Steroidobacteraceae bacterium]|nr:alpha/beta fold hydrolase [Steroidobacteraceae bacterium]
MTMQKWGIIASFLTALVVAMPLAAEPAMKVIEETLHVQGPIKGLKLGLRHASLTTPITQHARPVVLILHGAGVPVSGNPDFPLAGHSLMTALAEKGLDVWGLDYYGFGESDRYPEMSQSADSHAPLGRAEECADQVDAVMSFLKQDRHIDRIMLIGDSGGSLVAGVFATRRPNLVSRLILFGPETPYTDGPPTNSVLPAYIFVAPADLWGQFADWAQTAGKPDVLDANAYRAWAETYLHSDPTSATRAPPTVKIPNGRAADTADIERGRFTYDPGAIRAPTLIVMGEFDAIATLPGAEWLLKSLQQAPERRLVVIGHGSHTIQYETERTQLYRVIADFLNERE